MDVSPTGGMEAAANMQVAVGTHVEIELVGEAGGVERLAFVIVPPASADFARGFLGANTPLALAILGEPEGSAVAYHVGDVVEVRILAVSATVAAPPPDLEAERQAVIRRAVNRSEALNDAAFALAAGSKWGDYNPQDIPPDPKDAAPELEEG